MAGVIIFFAAISFSIALSNITSASSYLSPSTAIKGKIPSNKTSDTILDRRVGCIPSRRAYARKVCPSGRDVSRLHRQAFRLGFPIRSRFDRSDKALKIYWVIVANIEDTA
jgi:hypothetical protein